MPQAGVEDGLVAIVTSFVVEHDMPPTINEVTAEWNATHSVELSRGNVHYWLEHLVKIGRLKRRRATKRQFVPLSFAN